MKSTKYNLAILFFMFMSLKSFSQEKIKSQSIDYKTMIPKDWPKELDAVTAAGNTHKILLENDKVRVLEVTLAPGETLSIQLIRVEMNQ